MENMIVPLELDINFGLFTYNYVLIHINGYGVGLLGINGHLCRIRRYSSDIFNFQDSFIFSQRRLKLQCARDFKF